MTLRLCWSALCLAVLYACYSCLLVCVRYLHQLSQVHFEEFVEWWARFSEAKLQQAWKKTKKGFFRGQPTNQWRQKEFAARAERAKMFAERVSGRYCLYALATIISDLHCGQGRLC